MSFQNAQFNQENAVKLDRPHIQWRRGDMVSQDERLKNGCWQLTADQWQPVIGGRMTIVDCVHGGGTILPSYLLSTIHVAILAYQKSWYVIENDQVCTLAKNEYQAGARGRFRIFGLVKELVSLGYDQPAVITTSGLNSKSLGDAVFVHKKSIIATASKIAKNAFPLYAFWLPVGPGEKQSTRNNQYVTPPEPKLGAVTEELLETLFVGQNVIDIAEQFYAEAQAWSKPAASDNGGPAGHPEAPEEAFPPSNGQIVEEII